jgi:hypothetical protein
MGPFHWLGVVGQLLTEEDIKTELPSGEDLTKILEAMQANFIADMKTFEANGL